MFRNEKNGDGNLALVMGNLSDECVINAACTVNAGETLEPHTVVFGSNNAQCKQPQSTLVSVTSMIRFYYGLRLTRKCTKTISSI